MTCKDCIYYEACVNLIKEPSSVRSMYYGNSETWRCFKNRNNFIELPLNKEYISDVTKSVYVISENEIVECFVENIEIKRYLNELVYIYHCIDASCLPLHYMCELGKDMFLTREGAEKALYELWRSNQIFR